MKARLKSVANLLATLVVLPVYWLYRLGAIALGANRVFPGYSQAFALIPGLSGTYIRRAFYRLVLPRCGARASFSFGAIFSHPTAEVGRDVYVGPYCSLGNVTLEDDALLGSYISVTNGGRQHGITRLDIPIRNQPGQWPRVTIGRDTWIGDRAVVMANVGAHCVVGAGSVVTRPIPDYAIAMGVPARVVRYRDRGESVCGNASRIKSGTDNGQIT